MAVLPGLVGGGGGGRGLSTGILSPFGGGAAAPEDELGQLIERKKRLPTEPIKEKEVPGQLGREFSAAKGIVSGIFSGAVELGKLIAPGSAEGELGFGDFAKEVGSSVKRTFTLENIRDAASGDITWTEALFEDVGNIAGLVSLGTGLAVKGAGIAAKAGSAAKTAKAASALSKTSKASKAVKVEQALTPWRRPLRQLGKKAIGDRGRQLGANALRKSLDTVDSTFGTTLGSSLVRSSTRKALKKIDAESNAAENVVNRALQTAIEDFGAGFMEDATQVSRVASQALRRAGLPIPGEGMPARNAFGQRINIDAAGEQQPFSFNPDSPTVPDAPDVQGAFAERFMRDMAEKAETRYLKDIGEGKKPKPANPVDTQIEAWSATVGEIAHRESLRQLFDAPEMRGMIRHVDEMEAVGLPVSALPRGLSRVNPEELENIINRIQSPGKGFDVPEIKGAMPDVLPDILRQARDKGVDVVLPTGFKKMLDKWVKAQRAGEALNFGSKPLELFRSAVLYHSPRWAFNSFAGNAMFASIRGVLNPVDTRRAWDAFKQGNTREAIRQATFPHLRAARQASRGRFGDVPGDVPVAGFATEVGGGPGTQFQSSIGRVIAGENRVARQVKKLNEMGDNFWRTAVYKRELKRLADEPGNLNGLDIAQLERKMQRGEQLTPNEITATRRAAEEARRTMVDYANLSAFERTWMRKIFPFYSWQKGVLRLLATMPMDDPVRFAALTQLSKQFGGFSEEERNELPGFLIPSLDIPEGVPFVGGGKLLTRGLNPFADAPELVDPRQLADNMNPFLETLMNATVGKTPFPFGAQELAGAPFSRPRIPIQEQIARIPLEFPQGRLLEAALPEGLKRALPVGVQGLISPERLEPGEQPPGVLPQIGRAAGKIAGVNVRTAEEIAQEREEERQRRLEVLQSVRNQRQFETRRRLGITSQTDSSGGAGVLPGLGLG